MEDVLEELKSRYNIDFNSGPVSDLENSFERIEFVASVGEYSFRTYRRDGSGVIVYESDEGSGYAEDSGQAVRDIERFLMDEAAGFSDETLEQYRQI
ncbi:MAG: hypothetical protein ABEJ75_02835 [Candidatus Nanohaloarchaea archaeon]